MAPVYRHHRTAHEITVDQHGNTPLHTAARAKSASRVIQLAPQMSADAILVQNGAGDSAIDLAIKHGAWELQHMIT